MGSSFETATAITVGSFKDSVGFGNDDYFKFNLQNQGNIALSLSRLNGSANLELYNAFQTKINESTNPDSAAELINTALSAGTYYIKVSGESNYSLNFQSQQSQQQNNLFWRDITSGDNSIWYMSGMTIASTAALTSMAPEWTMDGIADFNQDGQQDFVWRLPATGESLVWYMNGTAIASTESLPTLADPWIIAGVADLNNDEKPDLLWRNPTTGENLIWYMNGTTLASTATLNSVPYAGWVVSGIGDMNGDGQQDIVWRNNDTGQNRIWHMNGATRLDNVAMRGVAVGWSMTGVMDYDRDGKLDTIWYQPETGRNNLWAMSDTELISATALPTLRGTWTTKPFQQIITPALEIDSAGNSSAQAFNIGTLTDSVTYKEWVSDSDSDWYEFRLDDRSEVRAIATGATVQIVNAQGVEENGILKVGTYYARVTGGGPYTLSITPLPIITVSDFTNATEPNTAGSFTISRTGSPAQSLMVRYANSETATLDTDCQTLEQSEIIPVGQASITLPAAINNDDAIEGDETMVVS